MVEHAAFQTAVNQFSDWRWRLSNLYNIVDKEGKVSRFEMNWAQEALFDEMHYMNVILKARQLGFTTFIQIFMLDACVFNTDIRAGTIAHTLGDAQVIFRDKVKYPYDSLPEGIKQQVPITQSNSTELLLGNNSSIRVGTSLRSGTLQYLHVSEYGKICAKFPEKAREVRTGALNTVQSGQVVFIESTAEGEDGDFYDTVNTSRVKQRSGTVLTPLDFKFHFYPWWREPAYAIDAKHVNITDQHEKYFDKLQSIHNIWLTDEQKAWYVKKAESQKGDMKREYPSTADEAFEASVEGAYYADQMAKAELDGRIGDFPHVPGYPVHSINDIGVDDANATWLFQVLPGKVRFIAYFEGTEEGMVGMLDELEDRSADNSYTYGRHYMPHDIRVREWTRGGLTRIQIMLKEVKKRKLGTVEKVEMTYEEDQIEGVRNVLGFCEFDEAGCKDGLKALRNYKKDWDEDLGKWKDHPRHDWASHGSKAMALLPSFYKDLTPEPIKEPGRTLVIKDGEGYKSTMIMDDAWATADTAPTGRIR